VSQGLPHDEIAVRLHRTANAIQRRMRGLQLHSKKQGGNKNANISATKPPQLSKLSASRRSEESEQSSLHNDNSHNEHAATPISTSATIGNLGKVQGIDLTYANNRGVSMSTSNGATSANSSKHVPTSSTSNGITSTSSKKLDPLDS